MLLLRRHNAAVIEILPDSPLGAATAAPSASLDAEGTLFFEATRGTAAAREVLATAHEARGIGIETAHRLEEQTKQLERVAGIVDDTRGHLDAAEVMIDKLTRPVWRRGFGGKRKGGARKDVEKKWDWKDWKRKDRSEGDVGGNGKAVVVGVVGRYDEFDSVVRAELRVQDELLGDASVVVEELRVLAIGIGEEIEKEAQIVDGIDAVEVSGRIRESNRKLRNGLRLK